MIAHNGEINTLRGNFNWIKAREKNISSPFASGIYTIRALNGPFFENFYSFLIIITPFLMGCF